MPKEYVRLVSFADAGLNEVAELASRFAMSRVLRGVPPKLAAVKIRVVLEDESGATSEDEAYFARIDDRFYFSPEALE